MNNKILAIFIIFIFVILAGCLNTQNYQMGGKEESKFVSDLRFAGLGNKGSPSIDEVSNVNGKTLPERKVISTATLTVEVASVQVAINDITNLTLESGGFVSSSSISDTGSNRKNGHITARVPQKSFYSAIEKIDALGTEKYRQVSGQDVTEEFIDLDARLDNLQKQETRLQEILKMATTVKDIIEVEHELERVRGEIESMTGRLNYLNQSVEMSTIAVTVMEPAPIGGDDGWGISNALRDAVRGFIESVRGIIIFTGFIIPILIYLGVAILIALGIKNKILPYLKR
ncbi:MAG: DUF4349 domain-containing protein [Candidatus Methanoperedens sp.]|nr:DUF4349 domain-containing protein [Candidatus Methanoperedens sp.]